MRSGTLSIMRSSIQYSFGSFSLPGGVQIIGGRTDYQQVFIDYLYPDYNTHLQPAINNPQYHSGYTSVRLAVRRMGEDVPNDLLNCTPIKLSDHEYLFYAFQ